MGTLDRTSAENAIATALLEQWDPLSVRETPGTHTEYLGYAHDMYNLLARGGSDTQITRSLHKLEGTELGHPELVERDISALIATLRAIEKLM